MMDMGMHPNSAQTRKAQAFLILRNAVDALEIQADPRRDLESLETAFKEFHQLVLTGMTALVDLVGGDTLYIPVPDFLSDDINTAFEMARREEDAAAPSFYAPYSTLSHELQGIAR
jgi:hypothetical protein